MSYSRLSVNFKETQMQTIFLEIMILINSVSMTMRTAPMYRS